jgi:triphosphoribosyl-dephospho-CoA synthase
MSPEERIALHAQLACLWEASARKAGNVHRYRDFDDTSYLDFLASAAALASVLGSAAARSVGETVLLAVERTRLVAPNNTNLGIILLLAPLAKAVLLHRTFHSVLTDLTVDDARLVYRAIRLANPGGLGEAGEQDVRQEPTVTLREAMALAADRDLIARQYVTDFADVLTAGLPVLKEGLERTGSLEGAILHTQIELLAHDPDSLIARKCGPEVAREASERAQAVRSGKTGLADLDAWLRADGRRRNPGTTADLIAAILFVALEEGAVRLPLEVPWEAVGFDPVRSSL